MGFMNLFKHFLGDDWGVHPDDHKRPAADQPVRVMPLPARLYLPLQQHLGGAARLLNLSKAVASPIRRAAALFARRIWIG